MGQVRQPGHFVSGQLRRLLLLFGTPRTSAEVFAGVDAGFPFERFDELVRRLVGDGVLIEASSTQGSDGGGLVERLNAELFSDAAHEQIGAHLAAGRAVVIPDAFDLEWAEELHRELMSCTRWQLYEGVTPRFSHHNLYDPRAFPPALLDCRRRFESADAKALAARWSGRNCDGELQFGASNYLAGDHSLPHTDSAMRRHVAFIWHLTKDWQPSWGGSLFWCPTGAEVVPRFNSLTLFNVTSSSVHFVAPVSPYARGQRLTINGWWTTSETIAPDPTIGDDKDVFIRDGHYGAPHVRFGRDGKLWAL